MKTLVEILRKKRCKINTEVTFMTLFNVNIVGGLEHMTHSLSF